MGSDTVDNVQRDFSTALEMTEGAGEENPLAHTRDDREKRPFDFVWLRHPVGQAQGGLWNEQCDAKGVACLAARRCRGRE